MADQVRSYSATDNVTKILGAHTLKFGIDGQTDSYSQPSHNRVSNFSYAADTKNISDSNYAYSNTLLGNFDTVSGVDVAKHLQATYECAGVVRAGYVESK